MMNRLFRLAGAASVALAVGGGDAAHAAPDYRPDYKIVLAVSGPYRLSKMNVGIDSDYVEFFIRRKLSEAERLKLEQLTIAQFNREPKWTLDALTRQIIALDGLIALSPEDQEPAREAYHQRTASAVPSAHFTAAELATLRTIVGVRYRPPPPARISNLRSVVDRSIDAYGTALGGTNTVTQLQSMSMHP